MVSKGSKITASDINVIIDKIQAEAVARIATDTTTDVVKGDLIKASDFTDQITTNDNINARHCWCEFAGGGTNTHNGGVPLALSATAANFAKGKLIKASEINEIDTDIDNLVAQCDCDGYQCTNNTVCSCNFNCGCNGDKWGCTNINYASYYCTCNRVCNCEYGG